MSDTSTALAIRRPAAIGNYLPPPPKDELAAIIEMANYLAKVPDMLPKHFLGQPYKIMAVTLYARELGIPQFTALQHMQVIDGKAGADAQLMATLVTRAGHKVDPCLDRKVPGKSRTCRITRGDTGVAFEVTWTIEMAAQAHLTGKDNWRNYPDSMLWARALSQCAREGCSDALMGVSYTPEEIGGTVDGTVIDGEVVSVIPVPVEAQVAGTEAGSKPSTSEAQPVDGPASRPTPSEGAPAAEVPQEAQPPAAEVPQAPPSAPVAPLAGPSVSRRMGAGRSISPVRKNTVTVTPAPQEATVPATAPEAPAQAVTGAEAVSGQDAPSALTDEPVLPPAPVDEGKRVYLDQQRELLRVSAAHLARVNVILDNVKRGLEGKEPNPVPAAVPSEATDQGLARLIDRDYPGRTLATLGEAELQNRLELVEGNLAKKRELMAERGISEE